MCARPGLSTLLFVALLVAVTVPAAAQTIEVQNGGTLQVSGGGVWNLEGSTVDLGGTGSAASITETGSGRFAGGTLRATRSLSSPSQADPAGLGLQISASADLGATTVRRGHKAQSAPNGNNGIKRYYAISPSKNNSGLSATLTFTYHDDELHGLTESNLELFKSTDGGQTWSEEGQDGRDASKNTVTLSGVGSFSRWTLGSTASPLPVELAAFEARAEGKRAVLQWQTASETNNAGFAIQHKGPSARASWTKIGYVESKAEGGTTTKRHSYQFASDKLTVGTHQFRLKQGDLDGSSSLSDPVTVRVQMQKALRLGAPAPNPVSSQTTLTFAVKEEVESTLVLYNTLGQRVRVLYRGTPTAGESQRVRLAARGLPSGVYVLRLKAGGQVETRRVTVVR